MKTGRILPSNVSFDWTWNSWKRVLLQTFHAIGKKDLFTYAAGVAYYGVLSFFPLIVALVSVAGLTAQQHEVEILVQAMGHYLPPDVAVLLTSQIQTAVTHRSGSILALFISVGVSLFGASGAMDMIMTALNKSYEVGEKRGLVKRKLVSILLTVCILVVVSIVAIIFLFGGVLLRNVGLPGWGVTIFLWTRWIFLVVCAIVGLSVLYNHAPNRRNRPNALQVSWGAVIATILWIVVSVLFYAYLQYFGNYSRDYSTYAGIIGLMVWLNYSAFVLLLGAEINYRLESK